jgi:hypothetical protein
VLVEGWGYTATAHAETARQKVGAAYVSYWKPEVLADNNAAFSSPSAQAIATLRDRYKVSWLFVDETQRASAALENFAVPRFRFADCAIYQIRS